MSNMNLLQVTILILISTVLTFGQNNTWNEITPLQSTRADVEKILKKRAPYSKAKDAATYITKNERVFVLYSTGACSLKPSNGWSVPKDTVIRISVEPKVKLNFSDFKLEGSGYKKNPDPELPYFTYFTNEEKGVSIDVNTDEGVITAFSYFPESKYDYLMCANKP